MSRRFESIEGFSTWEDQGELILHLLPMVKSDRLSLKVAEIGVYKGKMTAMWCDELLQQKIRFSYVAVDNFLGSDEHAKGQNLQFQFSVNLLELSSIIMDAGSLLIPCAKNSVEAAAEFSDGYFDIIYLDASHDFDSVCADIDAWWPKVRPGGILCGDDYIDNWRGVVKAVNVNFAPEIGRVGKQQWFVVK